MSTDGPIQVFAENGGTDALVALVVPRRHIRDLYMLPEELAGPVLAAASRLATAAKRSILGRGRHASAAQRRSGWAGGVSFSSARHPAFRSLLLVKADPLGRCIESLLVASSPRVCGRCCPPARRPLVRRDTERGA